MRTRKSVKQWVAKEKEMADILKDMPDLSKKVTVTLEAHDYLALTIVADALCETPTGCATKLLSVALQDALEAIGITQEMFWQKYRDSSSSDGDSRPAPGFEPADQFPLLGIPAATEVAK